MAHRSSDDASLVNAIVSLAQNAWLQVAAEGVETHVQAKLLQACGCSAVQGFLFGRPLPAEAMEKMLRDDVIADIRLKRT